MQDASPDEVIAGLKELEVALENGRRVLLVSHPADAEKLRLMGFHAVAVTAHVNGSVAPEIIIPFKGAEVLVLFDEGDNSYATLKKLGIALKSVAKVKYLDLQNYAHDARSGFSVAEWIDDNKTTADEFGALIDEATGDAPERADVGVAWQSQFGLIRWEEQQKSTSKAYQWLVAGLIPMAKLVLWYGPSQSGKSFSAFDCALHVALGLEYQGRRTTAGGVVYCFVEKGSGAVQRMQAFQLHHGYPKDGVPFAVLTKRFDLFASEKTVRELAREVLEIAKGWSVPLAAVVIDTNDKATPGADEISKKDVSLVVKRYELLGELTNAGVWVIAHTNASGDLRGNKVFYNEVETVIEIKESGDRNIPARRDEGNRIIRTARVNKQSEGQAGVSWEFTLRAIEVGKNEYGEAITSCVVTPPSGAKTQNTRGLKGNNLIAFTALLEALASKDAVMAPPGCRAPKTRPVVDRKFWAEEYGRKTSTTEPDPLKRADRVRKAMDRAIEKFVPAGLIGVDTIGENQWVWWTGKKIDGVTERHDERVKPDTDVTF